MSVRGLGVGVDEREYSCDVAGCGERRSGRKPQDARMLTVVSPELGFMPAGKRHFCSAECVRAWTWLVTGSSGEPLPVVEPLEVRPVRTLGDVIRAGELPASAAPGRDSLDVDDDAPDVPPLYPDGDAPGRVVSAREFVPRRSSVSE